MRNAYNRRPQDFKRRILDRVNDKKELIALEHSWLSLIKEEEFKKRYYNLRGQYLTKIIRDKVSNSRKGIKFTEEHRASLRNSWVIKRKRQKSFVMTDEIRRKISESNKGKHRTMQTRQKLSVTAKKRGINPMLTEAAASVIKGSRWFNDGVKNFRLSANDAITKSLSIGRI
jgi:hypothetical protein